MELIDETVMQWLEKSRKEFMEGKNKDGTKNKEIGKKLKKEPVDSQFLLIDPSLLLSILFLVLSFGVSS